LRYPPISVLAESAADLVLQAADAGNQPRVNGLNKACLFLHECVQVTLTCGGVLIPSATRNVVHRVDNLRGCSCESARAGRSCWHSLLVEIIEHAQIRAIPTADRIAAARTVAYAKAKAEMDELFA
jgi:hypothetical protein